MDIMLILIILAILATLGTLLLGLMTMSGGGTLDSEISTPLMWARLGLHTFTLLLLIVAALLR
jgi:hypothetical protein